MSDITPPYWVGGNPGAAFAGTNAAVANNLNNLGYNTNANLAYVGGQNQAALNNAYGPQGFGGQTDYYSALGAAYGRGTGGFGGGSDIYGVGYPSGSVTSGGDMPGYQLDPTPGVGAGGGYDPYATQNPFGGGGGATLPGGGINPNDPGNIAAYWAIMGRGAPAAAPNMQATLGYTPDQYLGASPYNDAAGLGGAYPSPYTGGALATLPGGGINPNDPGNIAAYWAIMGGRGGGMPSTQSVLGYTPDQYLGGPDYAGAGQFDPNSFANRFSAGGYYNPGTPAQISGVQPGGYDPLSGAQPPYTYQPGMVQGMGGPGDWIRQQIPGMQTLSPNDMTYQPNWLVNGNAGG